MDVVDTNSEADVTMNSETNSQPKITASTSVEKDVSMNSQSESTSNSNKNSNMNTETSSTSAETNNVTIIAGTSSIADTNLSTIADTNVSTVADTSVITISDTSANTSTNMITDAIPCTSATMKTFTSAVTSGTTSGNSNSEKLTEVFEQPYSGNLNLDGFPDSAKKCVNFLKQILKMARQESVEENIRNIIKSLLENEMDAETFSEILQMDLLVSPQSYLKSLKRDLPFLQHSLKIKELFENEDDDILVVEEVKKQPIATLSDSDLEDFIEESHENKEKNDKKKKKILGK